jgi:hypothetical protein
VDDPAADLAAPLAADRLRRVAAALAESGAALERLAPAAAGDQRLVAQFLDALASSLPTKRRHKITTPAQRRNAETIAERWVIAFASRWTSHKPPSQRALWRAIKADPEVAWVPRWIIERKMLPEWKLPR